MIKEFLSEYKIDEEQFTSTGLTWEELMLIRDDYVSHLKDLEGPARYLVESLFNIKKVHSVRYRIKNPDHLVTKIIRKRINSPERVIDVTNYKTEITDLIGIRILHLFKEDWFPIHEYIINKWVLKEKQTAYYRKGDPVEYIEGFEKLDCDVKEHQFGYRSVHYLISTKPDKTEYVAEIQVRTIFEEAWSEIDHKVRYPNNLDNGLLNQFLVMFNRLSGSADEMGSYVQFLNKELAEIERRNREQVEEKTKIISQLKEKVNGLELEPNENSIFNRQLDKIIAPPKINHNLIPNSEKIFNTVINPALDNITFPTIKHITPPVKVPDLSFLTFPKARIPDFSFIDNYKGQLGNFKPENPKINDSKE
ncbi:MAG: hypothetical protein ABFR05_00030 [Bacteroidota bacterium]